MQRVNGLDVAFVSDRLSDRLRNKARTLQQLREEPDKLLQTRMSSLESDLQLIGFYQYALGFSFDQVREAFSEAAIALLKVFELRGTSEAFQAIHLTVDPTKSEDDPAFVIGERPLHPPGTRDYSLTNSQDCFKGICVALMAGQFAAADKFAELMWDPPNASYIGPRSETCTPNQQHLAYAVKWLLQGSPEQAGKELKQVRYNKGEKQAAPLAKMVRGLAEKDGASFSEGLRELLSWHEGQVGKPYSQYEPEMYFCLPAVGLTILAVRGGLLKKSELPSDPYLPSELIPE